MPKSATTNTRQRHIELKLRDGTVNEQEAEQYLDIPLSPPASGGDSVVEKLASLSDGDREWACCSLAHLVQSEPEETLNALEGCGGLVHLVRALCDKNRFVAFSALNFLMSILETPEAVSRALPELVSLDVYTPLMNLMVEFRLQESMEVEGRDQRADADSFEASFYVVLTNVLTQTSERRSDFCNLVLTSKMESLLNYCLHPFDLPQWASSTQVQVASLTLLIALCDPFEVDSKSLGDFPRLLDCHSLHQKVWDQTLPLLPRVLIAQLFIYLSIARSSECAAQAVERFSPLIADSIRQTECARSQTLVLQLVARLLESDDSAADDPALASDVPRPVYPSVVDALLKNNIHRSLLDAIRQLAPNQPDSLSAALAALQNLVLSSVFHAFCRQAFMDIWQTLAPFGFYPFPSSADHAQLATSILHTLIVAAQPPASVLALVPPDHWTSLFLALDSDHLSSRDALLCSNLYGILSKSIGTLSPLPPPLPGPRALLSCSASLLCRWVADLCASPLPTASDAANAIMDSFAEPSHDHLLRSVRRAPALLRSFSRRIPAQLDELATNWQRFLQYKHI
ncbi:uncharacterized protein LOC126317498 isoform X1 [Schistocerca gregaria]|uniref:uncharacterized protein LOC126317498 isoform X1 n=1 Tax=Schistocerca gregaria TaxID=7010 RepID=UPI00211F0E4B|nr:uncharacterized protein LOC126317498 isoform X1 [Schistocerca gregaria]